MFLLIPLVNIFLISTGSSFEMVRFITIMLHSDDKFAVFKTAVSYPIYEIVNGVFCSCFGILKKPSAFVMVLYVLLAKTRVAPSRGNCVSPSSIRPQRWRSVFLAVMET